MSTFCLQGHQPAAVGVTRDDGGTRPSTGEERLVLDRFADAISLEDHKKRMDMLLYSGESSAALRVAAKLDGQAFIVIRSASEAGTR